MASMDRRDFLKLGVNALAAASVASVLPPSIRSAIAQTTQPITLDGIDHVIIFMQENRSFDHYFGMLPLPGVRGFLDPDPAPLPTGREVWYQPDPGSGRSVMPYPLNPEKGKPWYFQGIALDHYWKGSQERWENWDAWVKVKGERTMGYMQPADLPFYYALASAFTVCDAYHCSLFGPTNPNRRYLWTGTSGSCSGAIVNPSWKHYIVDNDDAWESNLTADPARDSGFQNGWNWQTYADVLEANGISWKVYQGHSNYGDNALAYFNNFRRGGDAAKIARARSFGGAPGDDDDRSAEALIAQLQADLQRVDANGKSLFPAVSWIVAPGRYSEHPDAPSSVGERFCERVLNTIIGTETGSTRKKVWDKCAMFFTYDENDGYFDHVPPPIPPLGGYGKHNLTAADGVTPIDLGDELYQDQPIGLGPRVPMLVVSPWSKGGRVSSRLSDHTSIIRFLETWLQAKGYPEEKVRCNNISAWRRAICGDLTETLNLKHPFNEPADSEVLRWQITEPVNGKEYAPYPYSDGDQFLPGVAPLPRPARLCELPYECRVTASKTGNSITLTFDNSTSSAAATFIVYINALTSAQRAFHYSVAANSRFTDSMLLVSESSQCHVYGPRSPQGCVWRF
jgi:phospholipase C